jgi:hypothetical protein
MVTIYSDVIYVNQIPFLVTISRNLNFGTKEALSKQNLETLLLKKTNSVLVFLNCNQEPINNLTEYHYNKDNIKKYNPNENSESASYS